MNWLEKCFDEREDKIIFKKYTIMEKCTMCRQVFLYPHLYRAHMKLHKERPNNCIHCGKRFTAETVRDQHQEKCKNKSIGIFTSFLNLYINSQILKSVYV